MSFTMGLYVMPKYMDCGSTDVYTVEGYFNYLRTTNEKISFIEWYKNKSNFDNYSAEELESIFTEEMIEFYKQHYRKMFWPWDIFKKHPRWRIAEDVSGMGWENAFAICDWLIAHSDTSKKSCMVNKTILEELLSVCKSVLENPAIAPSTLPVDEEEGTYDEDYFNKVNATIRIVERVLTTVDFEKNMIHFDFD